MNSEDSAQFEVTGHYFLPARGAFIIGQIRGGGRWMGTQVSTGDPPPLLTISGIEHLQYIKEPKCGYAFIFREQPTLEFLKQVFPIGTVIPLKQDTDDESTA
jgi:hypothetical protein